MTSLTGPVLTQSLGPGRLVTAQGVAATSCAAHHNLHYPQPKSPSIQGAVPALLIAQ